MEVVCIPDRLTAVQRRDYGVHSLGNSPQWGREGLQSQAFVAGSEAAEYT